MPIHERYSRMLVMPIPNVAEYTSITVHNPTENTSACIVDQLEPTLFSGSNTTDVIFLNASDTNTSRINACYITSHVINVENATISTLNGIDSSNLQYLGSVTGDIQSQINNLTG